jgi:transcription elongation GreA/GreB family factor
MVLPRDIRQRIENGDFEAVELAWLERIEEAPGDLDHFASVARSLVGAGQADLARTLLEILDEQLRTNGQIELRLELLRVAGEMMAPRGRLHSLALGVLRELYASRTSLDGLIETLELDRSYKKASQLWDRVARLESLLNFTEETVVWVEGHGPGHVADVNYQLEGFRIELEADKPDIRVGFRAAPKVLEALGDGHFLVEKRRDPAKMAELSPPMLLEQVMTSFDREMTAAEIRDAIQGMIEPSRWSSWWTSAKKHPQIVASPKVRNSYVWAASSEAASSALWSRYLKEKARGKVDFFRKHASQDPDLASRMARDLVQRAKNSGEADPSMTFEIALALERFAPNEEISLAAVVRDLPWERLLAGLSTRQSRERAYELARQEREDWPELYADGCLKETDVGLAGRLAEALREHDRAAFDKSLRRCVAQPTRAPALFTWLAVKAGEEEDLRENLGGSRLFKKIVQAAGHNTFSPYRKTLTELAESGGTLPRLLGHIDPDEAPDIATALQRASAFSADQRQALEDAMVLRFPTLREAEEPLYALISSIQAKQTELKTLLEEEIPANRRAIEEARAMGDLRENFEYKSARQRHEYLAARAEELSRELAQSKPLDRDAIDPSRVRIGTRVQLVDEQGAESTITLLGPWESSPENGVLSYRSEVAQALLGKAPGEQAQLAEGAVTVSAISVAQDLD